MYATGHDSFRMGPLKVHVFSLNPSMRVEIRSVPTVLRNEKSSYLALAALSISCKLNPFLCSCMGLLSDLGKFSFSELHLFLSPRISFYFPPFVTIHLFGQARQPGVGITVAMSEVRISLMVWF